MVRKLSRHLRRLLVIVVLLSAGPSLGDNGVGPLPGAVPVRQFPLRSFLHQLAYGPPHGPPPSGPPAVRPSAQRLRESYYGYSLGAPTYNWGYFGAGRHSTGTSGFQGYHEDFQQWTYYRGR